MSVIIQLRERARKNVSALTVVWAVAMTVVQVVGIVTPSTGNTVTGFVLCAALGAIYGWRRRVGATFFAPLVNWAVAWFPLWVASMVHFGFWKGFFYGLGIITIGWIPIGFLEFAVVGIVAFVFRARHTGDASVVIIDPSRD